jgi:hypothetical protein
MSGCISQLDNVKWIDLCGVGMGVEDLVVLSQLLQTNTTATALDLSFNKITLPSSMESIVEGSDVGRTLAAQLQ